MIKNLIIFQEELIHILKQKLKFDQIFFFSVPKDFLNSSSILINIENIMHFPSYMNHLYDLNFSFSVQFSAYGKNLSIAEQIMNIFLEQKFSISSILAKIIYVNHKNTSVLEEKIILNFNILIQFF